MRPLCTLLLPLALALGACASTDDKSTNDKSTEEKEPKMAKQPADQKQPDIITVDHTLIAYNEAPRMDGVTRSLAEAKQLAYELLRQINNDGDWVALKRQYSNDPGPTGDGGGPYTMTNTGAPQVQGARPRTGMVPAFGDVGFALEIGEVKVADQDPAKSPYGFHIIKRVK